AIGLSVAAALVLYARFPVLVPAIVAATGGIASWGRVVALIFLQAGAVMLGTTLLFGASFPLVARLVVDQVERVGARRGVVYAANTVGWFLGSLVVGFGFLPALGVRGTFVALVVVTLVLGATLAALAGAGRRATALGALGLVAAVATPVVVPADVFRAGFEQRFGKLLYFKEEVTDTVMVSEDVRGDRMIRYGDGRGTAGTMTVSDDRMYAHLPMLLHPPPRGFVLFCFGVGNGLAALVRHPIEWVEAVELSPGVVGAAPLFARTNRDVLADPRVRLTIPDGRNFLLTSHETYDVIR